MAGGVANDIRTPYPGGIFIFKFGPFEIIASKSADFVVEKVAFPFALRPKKAWVTAQDVNVTNAITLNLVDDTGTPKEIITDQALAAITGGAGSRVAITMASITQIINAGAEWIMSYASGASDTGESVAIWVESEVVF